MIRNYENLYLEDKDLKIQTNSVLVFVGASSTGKTTLLTHALLERELIFDQTFSSIHYFFSYPQPLYNLLEERLGDKITFTQGFGETFETVYRNAPRPLCLVVDDLDSAALSSQLVLDIAKGGAHHTGVTLILITQQIFHSPANAKYAREFMKQARGFIITQLLKERHSLRTFALQFDIPHKFLLSAYEQAVEKSPLSSSTPPHIFLNFGLHVKPELRCIGNFIRKSSTWPNHKADIRSKFWQIFKPMAEKAQLFYLVSEPQLKELQNHGNVSNTRKTSSVAVTNSKSVQDPWRILIRETIPSMVQYPHTVREKLTQLALYFKNQAAQLNESDELIFKIDDENVSTPDFLNVLLYFVTPSYAGSPVGRPRALYPLAKLLKDAPRQYFHNSKVPSTLLRSLRQYYRNSITHPSK